MQAYKKQNSLFFNELQMPDASLLFCKCKWEKAEDERTCLTDQGEYQTKLNNQITTSRYALIRRVDMSLSRELSNNVSVGRVTMFQAWGKRLD